MQGKIIKGIAGFYYVQTKDGIYECKAKGSFRNRKLKPYVGDDVEITVLDEENKKGNMEEILERKNFLIRPAVANVDQTLVIFAAAKPDPNLNLLDRFLIMMEQKGVPVILVFNKTDVAESAKLEEYAGIYENCGYQVLRVSALQEEGISEIKEILKGKTSTVAGPSGVGKSSIINLLQSGIHMETGNISEKIERGKHTTRHSELISIAEDTYIFDTPGFSSLYVTDMEKEELKNYFPEFEQYEDECKFLGCVHVNEPVCGVKEALKCGKISKSRYENYKLLYEELKENEKRKYS
jgi:ribosome biogenesis GTPase